MDSKLTLSQPEYDLVNNAEWFLTKQQVTEKVFMLFSILLEHLRILINEKQSLQEVALSSPKIFKGENYKGLPWVMLDYPRNFSSDHIFAIRTMFWWANYFVVTLHLKGKYKTEFLAQPGFSQRRLAASGFFIAVNKTEWQHDLDEENYQPVTKISTRRFNQILEKDFLKLSKIVPLTEWNNAENKIESIYREIISMFEA